MISRTLLIAARPFGGRLGAEHVAGAIAEGLLDGGWQVDLLPLDGESEDAAIALVRTPEFDARMRAARAVVIAEPRLDERTLAGTVAFEIATRARQGGVPAYAVTGDGRVGLLRCAHTRPTDGAAGAESSVACERRA